MKRLLWILPLLLSCQTVHVPPTTAVREKQQQVAARDIGWIYDSIPVVRFKAPWVYGMYRMQVESCVGRTKPGWPRLYVAPVPVFGENYLAAYFSDADAIVFGLGNENNPNTVRHELIHWLTAPNLGHDSLYFSTNPTIGRCAAFLKSEG